jgi:hypothetical protein
MMWRNAAAVGLLWQAMMMGQTVKPEPPQIGKPPILKEADVRPGMRGVAWTVFSGSEPEPVPVEILGIEKNMWGPGEDVILARMGGKAERTNVAGGMSGSPVYIDGKLVGAVALRLSMFSPDAICGITPIELMLEVNAFDSSKPVEARTPQKAHPGQAAAMDPMLAHVLAASSSGAGAGGLNLAPIATPLAFSGFSDNAVRLFGGLFEQMGLTATVAGGASSLPRSAVPAADWKTSLRPGQAVTLALVSGDMSVTGMCTVTYNDGKHVLACGHSFFNLGPADIPMAKGDVVTTLASSYQPNKIGNATEVVGALRQDRHSAILGELGATADVVPVSVKVRAFDESNKLRNERDLKFSVMVNQKWTPYLMMLTLFNSIEGLNEYAEESTYRMSGNIELEGEPKVSFAKMQAPGEMPAPAPMMLATWWGERFNRLYLNPVDAPKLKAVSATVDLLPDRRTAGIDTAWLSASEAPAGSTLHGRVFLRPYRGERIERDFAVTLPAGLAPGDYQILLSDAETLDRAQNAARFSGRSIGISQTISLLNQERVNNRLYVSLIEPSPTLYYADKALPDLPPSVMNVMRTGRSGVQPLPASGATVVEQGSIPFDLVVNGAYSLRIHVK